MIRVACIGTGNWGKALVRVFDGLEGVRLLYCCDLSLERLKSLQVKTSGCQNVTDYRKVIYDEKVDAVIIATRSGAHYTIAKESLLAGKHTFVEKPLAMEIKQAEELVQLAEKMNRKLMVGHLLLHHPAIEKMKQLIEGGELGNIYYVYSQRVNLGTIRSDENALSSFAPHDVSAALYLLEEFPDEVSAQGECYLQKGIHDVVFLTLRFSNKKMAQIHLSWLDPQKERKITVVGNKKMAVFDDTNPREKLRIYDKGAEVLRNFDSYGEYISIRSGDVQVPQIVNTEPLKRECLHFIDSIRFNRVPLTDGYNGLQVTKIIEAAQKSLADQGRMVKLTQEEFVIRDSS